jgi:hypothetical protein
MKSFKLQLINPKTLLKKQMPKKDGIKEQNSSQSLSSGESKSFNKQDTIKYSIRESGSNNI